ncbi:hypothetical protein ABVT39_011719 [Epinephelus coioides]
MISLNIVVTFDPRLVQEETSWRSRAKLAVAAAAAANGHVRHLSPRSCNIQDAAQGSVAQDSISTVDSIEDNEEPSSRSAFRDPPDGLTTELHGNAEYDPSQSFEEAFPDVGDWTYDDGHMFSEGFEEGSSEDCVEESNFKDTADKPLYDNASITVAECLLIIMAYVNCHKSEYRLLKQCTEVQRLFFSHSASSPIVLHTYCSNCFGSLEGEQLECLSCGTSVSEERSSSFIEVPIEAQIRSLFLKPGFQEKLNFRLSRKKKDPNIEDIYDAEVYKQLVDGELTSEPFVCKVLTIAGTCNLPAKALVLNSVQYNGKFGCHKCEQPGETVKTGERGHVHAFPYQHRDPKGPLRTNEKFALDMKIANETKTTVKGVKGPCWLSKLKSYNLTKGTAIDYMHSVLLGVMRLLMVLWFSTEFSRQPFSMAKNAKEIDRRFQDISPPSSTRYPRSVASHRMFFKASEHRDLLIFYGPVVFCGILATLYYNHFLLLSEAIFILLMESISVEQIDHAEKLLWNFCSQMANLYGERYETANVHLLVHLADSVRALGPLWTHSCFHFEDKNGYLLRLIHGTQNIPMQMVHAVKLVQSIPLISQTIKPVNAIAEFYTRMTKMIVSVRRTICLGLNYMEHLVNFSWTEVTSLHWKDMLVTASILKQ